MPHGHLFSSPGGHFSYRVIGACCRLFDRETLPYPCCRIEWRGKEPSWRRIGRRLTIDLATKNSPSYSVEIVGQEQSSESFVITLYPIKLPQPLREWWVSSKPSIVAIADLTSPESAEEIKIDG
ncbi:MAG: hypothetical protein HC780_29935 [Leptolyngbyaceae cyanobacterium CSU_1_3]|nr:hypothetical protein [Leptolyngbyaceae cyanobacterium CSU_1_3]